MRYQRDGANLNANYINYTMHTQFHYKVSQSINAVSFRYDNLEVLYSIAQNEIISSCLGETEITSLQSAGSMHDKNQSACIS